MHYMGPKKSISTIKEICTQLGSRYLQEKGSRKNENSVIRKPTIFNLYYIAKQFFRVRRKGPFLVPNSKKKTCKFPFVLSENASPLIFRIGLSMYGCYMQKFPTFFNANHQKQLHKFDGHDNFTCKESEKCINFDLKKKASNFSLLLKY